MSLCLIGLGSNLGDRQQTLDAAVARLAQNAQVRIVARSEWIETKPIGGPVDQSAYLNGAVLLETPLAPEALLAVLQQIEAELGRRRDRRWGPRTIDLDLLLYDQIVMATRDLVLPHPRMAWRRFVLKPAAQVAPTMLHPTTGWTIRQLLDHLDTTPYYMAIAGAIGAGKSSLAQKITERTGARLIAEWEDLGSLAAFYNDPARHAWQIELEFLEQRCRLLAADRPEWGQSELAVSDFWFDQSAAFARVWLRPDQWDAYRPQWERARPTVVRPRLIVLLELSVDALIERIRGRGRSGESLLVADQIDRIARSIDQQAAEPDQGPILRLRADSETALDEVLAAVEAMK